MVRRSLLLSLLVGLPALSGCAAPSGAPASGEEAQRLGSTSEPIVNGTPSTTAQNAVVYITIGTAGAFCSGTLIAPNLVLTARHCVQGTDENATSECAAYTDRFVASTLSISVGVLANGGAAVAHGKQTFVDTGTDMCSHDIGLILLDQDVTTAKIAPIRFDALTKGEVTATVGYGDDGSGQNTNGRYQRTALTVDFVGPTAASYTTTDKQNLAFTVHAGEVATGESTCFGDSGGPLLDAAGNVVGMTSRGLDEKCIDRPSIYTDTTSHEALIRSAASTAGHALVVAAAPAGAATEGDPNADGTMPGVDPGADESDPSTDATSGKKKSGYLTPQASAGCAVSGGASGSGAAVWLAVGLAVATALGARRRNALVWGGLRIRGENRAAHGPSLRRES